VRPSAALSFSVNYLRRIKAANKSSVWTRTQDGAQWVLYI